MSIKSTVGMVGAFALLETRDGRGVQRAENQEPRTERGFRWGWG